jgi:dipeptidyl aminopeptidase/acylaminoacyl peptidase
MYAKSARKSILPILILLAVSAHAQDDGRPMTVDDLLALQSVGDPQISPDGEWVAYTVRKRDLEEDESGTRIWMISTAGDSPIPMTSEDYSASNPRWSPDNKYLSFTAAMGEKEKSQEKSKAKSQVWNLNRLGGAPVQVTSIKQGVEEFEWSPDSSRLLLLIRDPKPADLTEDEEDDEIPLPHVIDRIQFKRDYVGYLDRRRTHIYLYTPGDEQPVQITSGDFDDADPVWSPDGQTIAFTSDRSDEPDLNYGMDIFTVAATGENSSLRRVTANPGRDYSPAWSPDGRQIAYVTTTGLDIGGSFLSPTNYLAITRPGEDERRILTPDLDRNVLNPDFSDDGRSINFVLEDKGVFHLASVRTNGRNLRRLISGHVSVSSFVTAGEKVVALVEKADAPRELYLLDDGDLAQLTTVNTEVLAGLALADVEKLQFESADGTPVEAFFVRPADFDSSKRYPTILWLHGGPDSQHTYRFSGTAQLFAANGYVVIMPNPRGSTGYGEVFARAPLADWGNKDFQDVMAAVDHGIELGVVDPDRMGVGGWSYGGILTNYVITQTTRFKAATSGASFGLVTALYGHDEYQLMYELEFGLPWEDPELWAKLSPFTKIEAITTPTLWMGGDVDWNVPIINMEQMYLGMKRLGRETQLVVYPGEHHGIRRPSFEKDRWERWLAWYGKYMRPPEMAAVK